MSRRWWVADEHDVLEVHTVQMPKIVVNIGCDQIVEVDKLYGPWAVWPVRCRLDYNDAVWIIEQQHCRETEGDETYWQEMARFDAWPAHIKTVEERQ